MTDIRLIPKAQDRRFTSDVSKEVGIRGIYTVYFKDGKSRQFQSVFVFDGYVAQARAIGQEVIFMSPYTCKLMVSV